MLRILSALILLSYFIFSQETGSFDTTIEFNGEQRTISMYVPEDYDASSSYSLLLGLHGAGDNSASYRNALIGQLQWETVFENTIFAFIDGGSDQSRDFYTPEGDEQIISETMDFVSGLYNINSNEIILQGFSLGGRAALKYGLDNPEMFKGLFLNTPAFQGYYEAINHPVFGFDFNFDNLDKIPIAITVGTADEAYFNLSRPAFVNMVKLGANALLFPVENMPHTIAPNQISTAMLDFINSPVQDGLEFAILDLTTEDNTCDETVTPGFQVWSLGEESLTSLKLELKNITTNETKQIDWTGDLKEFAYDSIPLLELSLDEGINNLEVYAIEVNGVAVEQSEYIDQQEIYKYGSASGNIIESFENEYPPLGWTCNESGHPIELDQVNFGNAASDGTASLATFN